jgi:uncharacterized protein (TIGR02246 family)
LTGIEELLAIREIEAVLVRYCTGVDDGDPVVVASVFAEDAELDVGNGVVISGRTDIEAFFRDRLAQYDSSSHHLANTVVQFDGEQAEASSYVYARIWPTGADPGELWGRYDDLLTRDSAGWQIRQRRLRAAGWHGYPDFPGRPEPFERLPRRAG